MLSGLWPPGSAGKIPSDRSSRKVRHRRKKSPFGGATKDRLIQNRRFLFKCARWSNSPSVAGLCAILVGLKRMGEAGTRRDREIDELGKGVRQQGQALEHQGRALEELLRRSA